MKNLMPLGALCVLCGGLFSCQSAPTQVPHPELDVNLCIVDAGNAGYVCNTGQNEHSYIPFTESNDLSCSPPRELELFLKACKGGIIRAMTHCSFQIDHFECLNPVNNQNFVLSIEAADNYACMNEWQSSRLLQRCKLNS
jgi:hypothetical protein